MTLPAQAGIQKKITDYLAAESGFPMEFILMDSKGGKGLNF